MPFWKLVAGIVVGNILTGIVAAVLWLLFIASLISPNRNAGYPMQSNETGTVDAIPSDAYFNIPADAKPDR